MKVSSYEPSIENNKNKKNKESKTEQDNSNDNGKDNNNTSSILMTTAQSMNEWMDSVDKFFSLMASDDEESSSNIEKFNRFFIYF